MGNFVSKFVKDFTGQTAAEKANKAQQKSYLEQQLRLMPLYKAALPGAMQYYSAITGAIDPNTGKQWSPMSSPAYNWQKDQAQRDTSRSLRALGREDSSFGLDTMANLNRGLAASEYDKQLSRLGALEGTARGIIGGMNQITGAQGQSTADMNLAQGAIKNQLLMAALQGLGTLGGGVLGGLATKAATQGNTNTGTMFSPAPSSSPTWNPFGG